MRTILTTMTVVFDNKTTVSLSDTQEMEDDEAARTIALPIESKLSNALSHAMGSNGGWVSGWVDKGTQFAEYTAVNLHRAQQVFVAVDDITPDPTPEVPDADLPREFRKAWDRG